MSMFCIQDARPVLFSLGERACRLAFDGCHYYFTLRDSACVVQCDLALCVQERFPTSRIYDCLCYDPRERCFWATARRCPLRIFRLDCCFREIDAIPIPLSPESRGEISGLSYNCCTDCILIAYPSALLELCKKDCCLRTLYRAACGFITGVCALSPGILITTLCGCTQELRSLDPCGELLSAFTLEPDTTLAGICYRPCHAQGASAVLDCLLLRQDCYPYLYERPFRAEDFGFLPCHCNDHGFCGACCCAKPCKPDCKTACAEVIESVALVEASLAHILNAEGEKLQKVIAESCDFDELMCVNREVNRTLINATQLEQALYAKLSVLSDLCHEEDCEAPCHLPFPPCRPC